MNRLTLTTSLARLPVSRVEALQALLHPIRSTESFAHLVVACDVAENGKSADTTIGFERDYTPELDERVARGAARVFWVYAHLLPDTLEQFTQTNQPLLERIARGLCARQLNPAPRGVAQVLEGAEEAAEELECALEELRADPSAHVMLWVPIELFSAVAEQFREQDDRGLKNAMKTLLGEAGYFEEHGRQHWCDPEAALAYAIDVRDGKCPAVRFDDHRLTMPCSDAELRAPLEANLRLLFELAFPGARITVSDTADACGSHLGLMGEYLQGLMPTPEAFQALLGSGRS